MKIWKFLIRLSLISGFLVVVIFVSVWRLIWNDLPQVYPISYPLVSNTELMPGETLVQEFKILSQDLAKISIPLAMGLNSNLLISINQIDGPTYSAEIKPVTVDESVMYTIEWPHTNWKKGRSVYITLFVPASSEKVGIGLRKNFVFSLSKFYGKAQMNGEEIINDLEFLPHYSNINEPILAGRYINPLEITYLLIYRNILQNKYLLLLSVGIIGISLVILYRIEVNNKYLLIAISLMILLGIFF